MVERRRGDHCPGERNRAGGFLQVTSSALAQWSLRVAAEGPQRFPLFSRHAAFRSAVPLGGPDAEAHARTGAPNWAIAYRKISTKVGNG